MSPMMIQTVSDEIRSGLVNSDRLKNMHDFAKQRHMLLHSFNLKDGTSLKLLANEAEYDCLIMKNGKVLTSRGEADTANNVLYKVYNLIEHLANRKRTTKNINADQTFSIFYDKYFSRFGKYLSKII